MISTPDISVIGNNSRLKTRLTARILKKSAPVFGAYSNFLPSLPSLSLAPFFVMIFQKRNRREQAVLYSLH
jgi:hypothetical protein